MERGEEIRARMLEDAPTDTPWLNAGDECAKKGGGKESKDRWQIDACPPFHLESAPGNANDVSVSRRVAKPPP